MATSLAAQLAQIRAHSTNALDLKAQKKAHSKSLLFDERHAVTQDFDTLFQICVEGFQELCRLDPRFLEFAGNLFSQQSKQEDRTQMTEGENKSLDGVLEDCMGLLGGRLSLKPAQKAMEWLIRRFSVHSYNTTCFILTFLPYHQLPIFLIMLSILPEQRPAAFKFLHPYIQSSANPPRHTVVHTAAHSQAFLQAFNSNTLGVCRRGQQYPTLLSFWSSINSEAVALMLDRSRLGRAELQKQSHEDVVLRIMPVLIEGLAMRHAPDLQVGCYMILTILSAKTQLSEDVLTGMMDRVVFRWENVAHAGLICLVALAQKRQAVKLPNKTFKAIVSLEHLPEDLALLKKHYRVEKLTLGMILGLLKRLSKAGSAERLRSIRFLLEANLMPSNLVAVALNSMLRLAKGIDPLPHPKDGFDVHSALVDLVLYIADTATVGPTFRLALEEADAEIKQYGNDLLGNRGALELVPVNEDEDEEMEDADDTLQATRYEELTSQIPTRTAFEVSLLSHTDSYIFKSLSDAFLSACQSSKNLHSFSELPVLRKSLAMTEPLYVSFFVRIWCGNYPVSARVAAITTLSNYFKGERLDADVQVLLPYVIYALGDASSMMRQVATELLVILADAYGAVANDANGGPVTLPILGKGQIYGRENDDQDKGWLTQEVTFKLIRDWLIPHIE
ncbi:MAG: hypothetical protein Q9174_005898, partial [Haloplaca sp. 1 TL-2023]